MKVRAASILATMLALAAAMAGCGDEDAEPTPTLSQPTVTPTATATRVPATAIPTETPFPTPTAVPTQEAGTRTGDPDVDRILEVLENANVEGLVDQTAILEYPCDSTPRNPQVFPCPPGAEDGSPIFGVFVSHVEGGLRPPTTYEEIARTYIAYEPDLVAAYRREGEIVDTAILFVIGTDQGAELVELALLDGKVTQYTQLAGPPPAELLADWSHPDWILPPADMVQTYPWSARTGVAVVDEVLAAIEADLQPPIQYTMLPCPLDYYYPGADCPNRGEELIEAVLTSACHGNWVPSSEAVGQNPNPGGVWLVAVGRASSSERTIDQGGSPESQYLVIGAWEGNDGRVYGRGWYVGQTGVVHFAEGCFESVEDFADGRVIPGAWLLPPR